MLTFQHFLEFQDGRAYRRLGASHKNSIRILQGLIKDNIDDDGETQPDILNLLTAEYIKGHRARIAKDQQKKHSPGSSPPPSTSHVNTTLPDPSKTLLATELKRNGELSSKTPQSSQLCEMIANSPLGDNELSPH